MKTTAPSMQPTDLKSIKNLVTVELHALNKTIIDVLSSDIPLIQTVIQHILKSGGKRMRPLVTLLTAKALNSDSDLTPEHIELAAIIEFVHTATLLHDDVIDHSSLRRGKSSANLLWGNSAAVLVGDFLYSRAFQLLTQRCNNPVMSALATTTNAIAEGEIMQLANQHQLITQSQYLDVIYRKTAILFASASQCAAIVSSQPTSDQQACFDFGKHFGLLFQIVDDILDYNATETALGKERGNDIKEGKVTLPLIYTMDQVNPQQQQRIRAAIEQPTTDNNKEDIISLVNNNGAIERCQQVAQAHHRQACHALNTLPTNQYTEALRQLTDFALTRIC